MLPHALTPGARVAIVSPAGPVRDRDALDAGLERLRSWGLEPELMPHCLEATGYLAGDDAARAADLEAALEDESIRGIFCSRGGYGTMRLLEILNLDALRSDPKPIIGYSDITALHAAALAKTGVGTFHGPMVASRLGEFDDATAELQRALLFDANSPAPLPALEGASVVRPGVAEGELVGGNLALVGALLGTPAQIDTRNRLLFLEDIDEPPYRLDRLLTQLRLAGCFDEVAGILLGDFRRDGHDAAELEARVLERLAPVEVPIVRGLPFGHRAGSWTLPFGVRARLDATASDAPPHLALLEPAVQ